MSAPISIDTPRQLLRPIVGSDFEPLWEIWSEPSVREFLISLPQNVSDFRRMFEDMQRQSADGTLWVVSDRVDGRVAGRCGFYQYGPDSPPELAFLLSQRFWGLGWASEAAFAALSYGFDVRQWAEVVAVVRPANVRAVRVLEKLGFSATGEIVDLRGGPAQWFKIQSSQWKVVASRVEHFKHPSCSFRELGTS